VIWESSYWKSDLIKDADVLTRWAKKRSSTKQYVLFEKKIFICAYSIRKLIESEKIGSDFPMWNFSVDKFLKNTSKKIDFMNAPNIEEFYDFENTIKESINISFLSDKLIHSYIFSLEMKENGEIDGFLFTSNDTKEKCIFKMDFNKFINILKWIGHSDVIKSFHQRDPSEKSGFKISRTYCFDDCIPRKGLPKKSPILYFSKYVEICLKEEQNR